MMTTNRSLSWVLPLFLFFWFVPAASAQAIYTFTKIADSSQVRSIDRRCISINNPGRILFVTADGTVRAGAGGALSLVTAPGASGQPRLETCPALNDADEVAYAFSFNSGYSALIKSTPSTLTELGRSDAAPHFTPTGNAGIYSLANSGNGVASGVSGVLYVFPDGVAAYTAGPSDPPLTALSSGTMNNAHLVAFRATRNVQGVTKAGIYRGSATPLVEDGDAVVAGVEDAAPAINDAGVVVFLARLSDGSLHVLSTSDGSAFVDHSGPIGGSGAFAINAAGTVVFAAAGELGVFTGPDAVSHKVIAPGDTLDGSTVVRATVSHESINDYNQISFWAELADGRSGVYRADPIPPSAFDALLESTMNTPISATLNATDPAGAPLSFSIVTNGARGSVQITDAAAGTFLYTPALNAIGIDTFTFQVTNGIRTSNVGTITVSLAPPAGGTNTPPVAAATGSSPATSVRFDALADELSRLTELPPITGFTMMGWFKAVSDNRAYQSFMRLGHAITSDGYNVLFCCGSGWHSVALWTGDYLQTGGLLPLAQWHHIAITVEGTGDGQVKVYKNGVLAITYHGNPVIPAQRLSIGNDAHGEWTDGNATTVKLYDAPLTAEEIVKEMSSFEPVRTAGLNSWYPLQSVESATRDFSGNGRTLTVTGILETDVNGPPLLVNVTPENTSLSGTLQASDADGNPLTYSIVTNGSNGSATITNAATGAYTYTPNPGATGVDTFTFVANDGLLSSNVATITVLIMPSTFPLAVTTDGSGTGTVTSNPGGVICTGSCTTSFERSTVITLTATPSSGSLFAGWSGACSGTGSCVVTIDGAINVTAQFTRAHRDVVTTQVGNPPAVASPGTPFSVSFTTQNTGTLPAVSSWTRFYLSLDGEKNAGDIILGVTGIVVPALDPDQTATISTSMTVLSHVPTGLYRLLACADDRFSVIESNETNNCLAATGTLDVQRPDLVQPSVTTSAANVSPGVTISVTDATQNTGAIAAAAFHTRYYLSTDAVKSPNDIMFAFARSIATLNPGATSTATSTLTVPASTPVGTYYLIACADDLLRVAEVDENNNCAVAPSLLTVALPDFVQISVSATVTGSTPGAVFNVTDTVENRSGAPAGASTTRYYLSPDGQIGPTSILLIGTRAIGVLAGNTTQTAGRSVTVPTTAALGTYYLVACADNLAAVPESNEANNCATAPATIVLDYADFVVTSLTVPAQAAGGMLFTVTDTTLNQGSLTAPTSTTRYYLSADGVKDAGDLLLAGQRSVPVLAGGTASTGGAQVRIANGTAVGAYVVFACADDGFRIIETSEVNNCLASSGTLTVGYPDLVQTAISNPPASIVPGGTFTITDSVANQGTIVAPTSNTRYYLSRNGVKDGSAILLGTRTLGALAIGAVNTGPRLVTVPSAPSGVYYVLACADDTSAAIESNELNNCLAAVGTTTVP